MASFWIMCTAMMVMTFALTFAGVVQVHLQRVLGQGFMEVQDQLAMFYWVRLGSGAFVVISAVMFVWAVLVPGRQKQPVISAALQPAE
jgi:nitric oxide reductase subunit B